MSREIAKIGLESESRHAVGNGFFGIGAAGTYDLVHAKKMWFRKNRGGVVEFFEFWGHG